MGEQGQIRVSYLKTGLKIIDPLFIELWQLKQEKTICFVIVVSCELVAPFCLLHLHNVATSSLKLAQLFVLLLAPNAFLISVIGVRPIMECKITS